MKSDFTFFIALIAVISQHQIRHAWRITNNLLIV